MQKLEAVETARALMAEGCEWGVWRWLFEKSRVRRAADRATDALAAAHAKVKSAWSDDLKSAYAELAAEAALERDPKAKRQYEKAKREAAQVDSKLKLAVKRVKDAEDEAGRAVEESEALFEEAERRLNAGLARQAAQKALESYDLREKAIRRSEAARRAHQA